jgi:secreted trypsin-like serine protease
MRVLILGVALIVVLSCVTIVINARVAATTNVVPPPSLVALINSSAPQDDLSGSQFCAGVLIAVDRVLTARHCVSARSPSTVDAIVGADNLCSTAPINGVRRSILRILAYSQEDGDGAVLVLDRAVSALPAKAVRSAPTSAVEAWGWGKSAVGGVAPCRAEQKRLRIVDSAHCADVLNQEDPTARSNYFCALPSAVRNTCEGDSGGPVFVGSLTGSLLGIVAAGDGCGRMDSGSYLLAAGYGHLDAQLQVPSTILSER